MVALLPRKRSGDFLKGRGEVYAVIVRWLNAQRNTKTEWAR
jgi:hypothetical protein